MVIGNSKGVGVQKPEFLKESMKLNWILQGGGGGSGGGGGGVKTKGKKTILGGSEAAYNTFHARILYSGIT